MGRSKDKTAAFFARRLAVAKNRAACLDPEPRPRQAPQIFASEDADAVRRLGCANYGVCLDLAFASCWEGFGCHGCPAFRLPTQEEFLSEVEAMAALLGAVMPRSRRSPILPVLREVPRC